MTTVQKVKTFVSLVIAAIQGDDAEVKAIKLQSKASAALAAQIATKKAVTLEIEDKVDSAREAIENAKINGGNLDLNRTSYITELLKAKKSLVEAEKELNAHLEDIAYLEQILEEVKVK